ncbi:hypothetical protein GCM10009117_05570 [Gangjinia marincola]|uniref:Bor protein n=1 Tax=Gangjinia marincola TaxID=578463 RepID=A0ABP3XQA2_9FLAO
MNKLKNFTLVIAMAALLVSCFSQMHIVGQGAQGSNEVTKWNHYVIAGLAPVGVSDPAAMANGAKDYTVHTRHSFINGLVAAITFNIYTPTTTTVKY